MLCLFREIEKIKDPKLAVGVSIFSETKCLHCSNTSVTADIGGCSLGMQSHLVPTIYSFSCQFGIRFHSPWRESIRQSHAKETKTGRGCCTSFTSRLIWFNFIARGKIFFSVSDVAFSIYKAWYQAIQDYLCSMCRTRRMASKITAVRFVGNVVLVLLNRFHKDKTKVAITTFLIFQKTKELSKLL